MTFYEIEQSISQIEREYFTGAFSESVIRNDLQNRKAMDSYSTLGSTGRQTNELGNKKDFYIQDFNGIIAAINKVQTMYSSNSEFVSRCDRCINQINRLLGIVRSF